MKALNFGLALTLISLAGCSSMKSGEKSEEATKATAAMAPQITHEKVNRFIQNWPPTSKQAAHNTVAKYGLPQEMTPTMLIWEDNRPFKRTIVHREEVTHNFPFPHADVLEQVVKYRVPASKAEKLLRFDGSISYDRTRGELSTRCDREEMNIIALNLADELIRGESNVDQARLRYAQLAQAFLSGNATNEATTLMFSPLSESEDADQKIKKFPGMKDTIQAEEARDVEEAQGTLESDNLEL